MSSDDLKNTVLQKLQTDPLSITPEEARRMSEQFEASDPRSAKIISAVESLALAAQDFNGKLPSMGHDAHHSLMTLVTDLKIAVDNNPNVVTSDILRTTQGIVSKMQRAIGQTNAPHPELEAELQAEIAKIEPKIEQRTVTKAEADHLHSLEARAHGHTEKGGITAVAQSVAAKRERSLSFGDPQAELQVENAKIEPKVKQGTVSKAKADHLHSLEVRARGYMEKGGVTAVAQSIADKRERTLSLSDPQSEFQAENTRLEPKIEQGTVTKAEADHLHSLEVRAHGYTEKGGATAVAQSIADKRERKGTLSDTLSATTNETGSSVKTGAPTTTATSATASSGNRGSTETLSKGEEAYGHARKASAATAVEAN